MSIPVDIVQAAATRRADEISDLVVLAMRGSMEFSLVFRLLRERESGLKYAGAGVVERILEALAEIEAIARRIRERVA